MVGVCWIMGFAYGCKCVWMDWYMGYWNMVHWEDWRIGGLEDSRTGELVYSLNHPSPLTSPHPPSPPSLLFPLLLSHYTLPIGRCSYI